MIAAGDLRHCDLLTPQIWWRPPVYLADRFDPSSTIRHDAERRSARSSFVMKPHRLATSEQPHRCELAAIYWNDTQPELSARMTDS